MKIVFKYIISNSSDKVLGPLDLGNILGPFNRDNNIIAVEPDGYAEAMSGDMMLLEDVSRKIKSIGLESGIEEHLIHVFRDVDAAATSALRPEEPVETNVANNLDQITYPSPFPTEGDKA